jgi:hypothetical protein
VPELASIRIAVANTAKEDPLRGQTQTIFAQQAPPLNEPPAAHRRVKIDNSILLLLHNCFTVVKRKVFTVIVKFFLARFDHGQYGLVIHPGLAR